MERSVGENDPLPRTTLGCPNDVAFGASGREPKTRDLFGQLDRLLWRTIEAHADVSVEIGVGDPYEQMSLVSTRTDQLATLALEPIAAQRLLDRSHSVAPPGRAALGGRDDRDGGYVALAIVCDGERYGKHLLEGLLLGRDVTSTPWSADHGETRSLESLEGGTQPPG